MSVASSLCLSTAAVKAEYAWRGAGVQRISSSLSSSNSQLQRPLRQHHSVGNTSPPPPPPKSLPCQGQVQDTHARVQKQRLGRTQTSTHTAQTDRQTEIETAQHFTIQYQVLFAIGSVIFLTASVFTGRIRWVSVAYSETFPPSRGSGGRERERERERERVRE